MRELAEHFPEAGGRRAAWVVHLEELVRVEGGECLRYARIYEFDAAYPLCA